MSEYSHYVHHVNPVILHLVGPFAIRWYGLSYLMGFLAALLLLKRWSRRGRFDVPTEEIGNFVVGLAFFGVFLGGRIGYVLFYGFAEELRDPLFAFRIWNGGMASHGGMIGTALFMFWYAKRNGHAFWNLADNMACVAPLGIAFGRLANFVNGELVGRITNVPWAVVFPEEADLSYADYDPERIRAMLAAGELHPRHPSQLYQAACEGFLTFVLLLLIRRTAWGKRPGACSVAFFVIYALARIAMECFREPDSTVYFGWLTKGQLYSALMLVVAGIVAWRKKLFLPQTEP